MSGIILASSQNIAAGTYIVDLADDLGAPTSILIEGLFTYVAASATSKKAYVQTSIDNGANYFDVACLAFTTATAKKFLHPNVEAVVAAANLTDCGLADDTALKGRLGNKWRTKFVIVGTYGAGTALLVNAFPRYA